MLSATRQEGRRHYTVPKGLTVSISLIYFMAQSGNSNNIGLCLKNASMLNDNN